MKLTEKDLIVIIEKSGSLEERTGNNFKPDVKVRDERIVEKRLTEWIKVATGGSEEDFLRRLAFDNRSMDEVRGALGPVKLTNPDYRPDWGIFFREMIGFVSVQEIDIQQETAKIDDDGHDTIPFIDFYIPFAAFAKKELQKKISNSSSLLTIKALEMMERSLCQLMDLLFKQTLYLEFRVFKTANQSGLSGFTRSKENFNTNRLYSDFIKRLLSENLVSFFKEYSVLAKLCSLRMIYFLNNIALCINRIHDDIGEIGLVFQGGKEVGKINGIHGGISNTHNQGQTVLQIDFVTGFKLIYRPRNLDLEAAFSDLVKWLNENSGKNEMKAMKTLNKNSYGWIEYIDYPECKTKEGVERYYYRMGWLICLIYILMGKDCHAGNIIANGDFPVLIDLELIMHPVSHKLFEFIKESENISDFEKEYLSVLGTGFLPVSRNNEDSCCNSSGVFRGGHKHASTITMKWININRDDMKTANIKNREINSEGNVPLLDNKRQSARRYTEHIVNGFTELYNFFITRKKSVPLDKLKNVELRFVFRFTSSYTAVQTKSLQPGYLRDGVDRSIQIDSLSGDYVSCNASSELWRVFKSEQRQMEDHDIPIFSLFSDRNSLKIKRNETLDNFFTMPLLEQVKGNLNNLNAEDIGKQIDYIRNSLEP